MSDDQRTGRRQDADERASQPGQRAAPESETIPLAVFLEFLRRLHDGPPQHAAAVRVALAVWEQAVAQGDAVHGGEAVAIVRGELDRLIADLTELQETGRRWAGRRALSQEELAAAAALWEASLDGSPPPNQSAGSGVR